MIEKGFLLNLIIGLLIIYVLFGIYLFLDQKSMIYFPDNRDFEKCSGFNDYEKRNYEGTRFYYKAGKKDTVIVHYHGNAGSACDRSFLKSTFEKLNNSVIFVEYAGYSNDSRKPSISLILKDVENVRKFIQENKFKKVIVFGQSIGSGPASYQAFLGNVNSLILVTPFSSMKDLVQSQYKIYPASLLLTEKYNNVKWLQSFVGNLIILHGDSDLAIPNYFSRKLFDAVPTEDKEYVLINGKGHYDIWDSKEMEEKIVKFIDKNK
jgi:uncharacterized protein